MRRRAVLAALGGALALTGCGLSERPYVERREWPLIVRPPVTLPPRQGGRVLLVRGVSAAPGLDARGLLTLQPNGSMTPDFYEQWSVPPASAMAEILRQWLAGSGAFAAVITPGSRLNADLALEGQLTVFWVDAATRTARVSLGIVLLDQRNGTTRPALQQVISAQAPVAGLDAPSIVAGMKAAVADAMTRVEAAVTPRS